VAQWGVGDGLAQDGGAVHRHGGIDDRNDEDYADLYLGDYSVV
jgi:hypothetical protein